MNREKTFSNLYTTIHLDNTSDYDSAIKNITKKLNESYYADTIDNFDKEIEHCYVVGSIGRGTAIKQVSDVDMLFVLPKEVFERFDQYANNGQSALLQDVKGYLVERYPRTEIKGDGQAVVISFDRFSIDLVPAFSELDGSFKYADSNNGGFWKNTNPLPEQKESKNINIETNNNFIVLSNFTRLWKDNTGFVFGGLLIDTLVHSFFKNNPQFYSYGFSDFHEIIIAFLEFLSKKTEDSKYYALGSFQEITDKGKGAFIKESANYLKSFAEADNDELKIETVYQAMFGNYFATSLTSGYRNLVLQDAQRQFNFVNNEQFIENLFPVNIKYSLRIDCNVTADGFRPKLLSRCLWLPIKRKLEFFIQECNVPKPYNIYWKIRNTGIEAYKKNMLRGEIIEGSSTRIERTSFNGDHYVECYIVKNGVCVARNRMPVRINSQYID